MNNSAAVFLKARQAGGTHGYLEAFAGDWAHQGLHIASRLADRSLVLLDTRGIEIATNGTIHDVDAHLEITF